MLLCRSVPIDRAVFVTMMVVVSSRGVPLSFASTVVDEDHWALVLVGGGTFLLMLRPFSGKNLSLEMKVIALFLSKLQFTIMIKLWFMIMFTSWDMEVLSDRASVPELHPSGMP